MSPLGLTPASERLLWLALAAFSALPFLVAPLPIMPDLFTHIGRYHVMNNPGDRWLSQYYAFDWHILGNLGFDLLMAGLGPLLGTERAAFLLAGLIPPLMVLGLMRLARALYGHVPAPAYFALLLVWTFTFFHGFVNYWLGIALVFHVAASWVRVREKALPVQLVFAFVVALLVWLCHTTAWGVLGILIAGIEFDRRDSWRRFILVMLPWAAPILPMIIWRNTKGGGALMERWWPAVKVRGVFNLMRAEWEIFDIASVFTLILLIIWLCLTPRLKRQRALMLAAAALFAVAIALPSTVLSSYFADVRLFAPLMMVALLGVYGGSARINRVLVVLALLWFSVRIAETTIGWTQRGHELSVDLAALDQVPMGARIATLGHSSECGVWPLAGRGHAPSLAIPRRNAFVNTEWDIPGQHLMRPIYNSGIGFNDSRSAELFNPAYGCPGLRVRTFLRYLPRDRFDYVWIWEAEAPATALSWLTPVYTGPTSRLYRIRK
jgi:hypothetical protein